MNTEVSLRVSLTNEPVIVRAIIADICEVSIISSRLAKKLRLDSFQDVFITDKFGGGPPVKWKISLMQVIVTFTILNQELSLPWARAPPFQTRVIFPVVNGNESGGFYEMILGEDCHDVDIRNVVGLKRDGLKCTPGPAYTDGGMSLEHHARLSTPRDLPADLDVLVEYSCVGGESIRRVAINRHTHQMAVQHRDNIIYVYVGVLKSSMRRIEAGDAVQDVVNEVRGSGVVYCVRAVPARCADEREAGVLNSVQE